MNETRQVQNNNNKQTVNGVVDKLASIKLNDAFAFSSLRAPKKSASGGNLSHTLGVTNTSGKSSKRPVDDNLNAISSRKYALQKSVAGATGNTSNNNSNNNNNSSNNELAKHKSKADVAGKKSSSVWFEYGCV